MLSISQYLAGDDTCSKVLFESDDNEYIGEAGKEAMGSYEYIGSFKDKGYNIYWKEKKKGEIYGPFFLYFGPKQWFVKVTFTLNFIKKNY